ncbi:MAG: outer membrane lipoprotein-sorting protein [Myxococcota bacterium]
MRKPWGLVLLIPALVGFDGSRAREALDLALHNLYGADLLAGVELTLEDPSAGRTRRVFAFGRKRKGSELRTLVFDGDGRRNGGRALLFQRPGRTDRIFVSDGKRGGVRPLSAGQYRWPLFGSDFSYEDFRAHTADEYRIEVLGPDRIDGEATRVLRLRPLEGPYQVLLVWLSTERPIILRSDYFDENGLWKRYRAHPEDFALHYEWWVPMRDEMRDLRRGRRTLRRIRNLLIDTDVPDELFTLTQLARGRMPSF